MAQHPWLLFLGIAVGSLMSGIDFLAMSVAVEPMAQALQADVPTVQWFLTAFAIGNSSFLVTSGRLADLYGKKTIFILSSIGFILSSLWIALSHSSLGIILARLIQGASSGATTSSAIAILAHLYSSKERTRWIAGLVGTTGLGMALGPTLAGFLIHAWSWRMVFLINLPLGLLGLTLTVAYMPKQPPQPTRQPLNLGNMFLFTIMMVLFTIGISRGSEWGWGTLKTGTVFGACLLTTLCFVWVERFSSVPLIETSLFKKPNFLAANAVASCLYFTLTGWTLLFGLYLERVAKMPPQKTGLILLPFGLMGLFLSTQMNRLLAYFSVQRLVVLGCGMGVIAFGGMSLLPLYPSDGVLVPLFMLFGGCFILVNSCTMQAALEFVPLFQAGIASGKSMMVRWLSGAVGAVISTTLLTSVAWGKIQKLAFPYEAFRPPEKLDRLHRAMLSPKSASLLSDVFHGETLLTAKQLIDQSYHQGLIFCMLLFFCFSLTGLVISHCWLKKQDN